MISPLFRTDDHWWGDDKLAHGFGAYAIALTLPVAIGTPAWVAALVAIAAGALVELVELVRFLAGVPPAAGLVDRISLKDLVWDVAGALVGWLVVLASGRVLT